MGRRIAALAIDWACAVIISIAFFSRTTPLRDARRPFAIVQAVFLCWSTAASGTSSSGCAWCRRSRGPLGLWRPFARTVLLCLAIPAVIWDRDQRGLHDRLIGTILVER